MIILKENGVEDKANGLTDSLKDKLGISSFFKKVSFIGACGFLNFFVFILRRIPKNNVQVKNLYIDSFTKIIKLINNNVLVFIMFIGIGVLIFFAYIGLFFVLLIILVVMSFGCLTHLKRKINVEILGIIF